MKHLKIFENIEDDIELFDNYLTENYLKDVYGIYDFYTKKDKNNNIIINVIFSQFNDLSSRSLNELSDYLQYTWDIEIKHSDYLDHSIFFNVTGVFMVSEFILDFDYFEELLEDIKIKKNSKNFNL